MTDIYALIPARGGSKGLSGKNMRMLNGKPLLAYTVEAAAQSGIFTHVVVTSDDEEILSLAEKLNAETEARDPALAEDETPMGPVIAAFIQRRQLVADDIIVLLQPTSPLRTARHIDEAYQWFTESDCNCLVSVKTIDSKVLKASIQTGNYLSPIYQAGTEYKRRQDLPTVFLPNGAIYIFRVKQFLVDNTIPCERVIPFMMNLEDSFDIDTEADLRHCSRVLLGMPERRNNE